MVEKVFKIYTGPHCREEVYREGIKKISAPIKKIINHRDFIYYERPFISAFKKTPIVYKQALIIPHLSIRISKLYTKGFIPYKNYKFYIDIGNVEIHSNYVLFKDLFLDIIEFTDGTKKIEDKEELIEALEKGWITKEEYIHANNTCKRVWKVVKEIPVENFIKEIIGNTHNSLFKTPT